MPDHGGGPLIAGLPMYDWPELRWATDALWRGVAQRLAAAGIAAPATLSRELAPDALWRSPRLLLGQTCGYPYVTRLRDVVTLVATPCYDAEGCAGSDYSSAILVRADDPAEDLRGLDGRSAVINAPESLSGCLALHAVADGIGFGAVRQSGSHRRSMGMVADGAADVCAIDAVCWALAQRHDPGLSARLRVLVWSPPAPALPFVCSAGIDVEPVRKALRDTLADPALAQARAALLLGAVTVLEDDAYDRVVALARRVGPGVTMT